LPINFWRPSRLCVATTIIINSGKAKYAWVTLVPLAFVGSTTLVAGFKSITDIFWPLVQNPKTSTQGFINTSLTGNHHARGRGYHAGFDSPLDRHPQSPPDHTNSRAPL
jgi:hypothetical protein